MKSNLTFKRWVYHNLKNDCMEELNTREYYSKPNTTMIRSNAHDTIKDYSMLVAINTWGMGGEYGNCYDNSMYHTEGSPKPEFTELDEYIESFCPNITFMQYRRLVVPLIKSGTYRVGEYYGGSSNYGYEYVHLEALWNAIRGLYTI